MTRRIKIERRLLLIGLLCLIVSFVVVPVVPLAVPFLITTLVMMLTNIKREMSWSRQNKAARAQALADMRIDCGTTPTP